MQEERIKYLIDRYYQGISTEEEEVEIREFFAKNSISGFEDERILFNSIGEMSSVPEPSIDFEEKILVAVDEANKSVAARHNLTKRTIFMSIAAVALVLIGSYIFFTNYDKPVDTYDDPQLAYNETVKILGMVSDKLNVGLGALEPINKVSQVTSSSLVTVDKSVSVITDNMDLSKRIQ